MLSDETLIAIVHRRHQQCLRWGKLTGVIVIVWGFGMAAVCYWLIHHMLTDDSTLQRLAAARQGQPQFADLMKGSSFLLGLAVGSLLMLGCGLGLVFAFFGFIITLRGDWRDRLIVRLTNRGPAAE
jgi:hypothetical protein